MKFNFLLKRKKAVTNHEGAKAFVLTPALELYTAVVTTALSDKFYEGEHTRLQRIRDLVVKNDPVFVAKLAVYAREKMHLRSVPLALAVELARVHSGDGLVAKLIARVVQRADEITELLACYALANDRKGIKQLGRLSKQVQKGLAAAFNKFDAYQFAKYNRDATVKLRDALFLVHPKAKDEAQQAIFDQIVRQELAAPHTWEVALSRAGQDAGMVAADKLAAKKLEWEKLILTRKLGYMALLRNLRNILEANISNEALALALTYLSDKRAVAGSRQLPFRFLSAYREVQSLKLGRAGAVLDALEQAVLHSAGSIAGYGFDTRVVIAADVSGSMQRPVSPHSKVQNFDVGLVLAMLLQSKCKNVLTGMFGDSFKTIQVPKYSILANVMAFHRREGEVGYATNGYLVIDNLIRNRYVADKVMLFTDCQLWNNRSGDNHIATSWAYYKQYVAPQARLYLFDLSGYGTVPLQVMAHDVHLIAGWSDKIFEVLHALEEGGNALTVIDTVEL